VVLDGGPASGTPSTVVDCTTWPPVLLREGALPFAAVVSAARGG
jgi:tRNA A37 threonylcarbamoyladenosine synthetase subunit TsaC/SUA5/YrdC